MERELESVEPKVWSPEKAGNCIKGILVGKMENLGKFDSRAYKIENDDGQFIVWGSTVLNDRMNFVDIGEYCEIEFRGTEHNQKGQPVKLYAVRREKRIKVTEEKLNMPAAEGGGE